MFQFIDTALSHVRSIIAIICGLMIGYIMVFKVGLPLVMVGINGGFVPLLLGLAAFVGVAKHARGIFS